MNSMIPCSTTAWHRGVLWTWSCSNALLMWQAADPTKATYFTNSLPCLPPPAVYPTRQFSAQNGTSPGMDLIWVTGKEKHWKKDRRDLQKLQLTSMIPCVFHPWTALNTHAVNSLCPLQMGLVGPQRQPTLWMPLLPESWFQPILYKHIGKQRKKRQNRNQTT